MLVDTSKLKRDKAFENEKVGVSFSIGQSDEQLSFYINDDEWGKKHHILWGTSSDRYNKSYDYANEKIRAFVQDKIDRWVMEEEEEVKNRPWFAIEKHSDKLTPEQLDYCIHETPGTALKYCADKLTAEQLDYCVRIGYSAALLYCADKLTAEQFDYCLHKDPWAANEYCADKLTDEQKRYCEEQKNTEQQAQAQLED